MIDDIIVWYGNMELLSKEDLDDCIMRIEDRNVAAELLELTFSKDSELTEYDLPLA